MFISLKRINKTITTVCAGPCAVAKVIHIFDPIKSGFSTKMKTYLPHFSSGLVVKGFGRGSKELGIPTANFPEEVVSNLPDEMETGVYYGFSQVDQGPVYKMVMSIGWNPYYKNEKKSMETHLLHKFDEDFYGKILKVVILDYVRPELNFNSLEELIDTIKSDISIADKNLDKPEYVAFKTHEFFS